MRNLSSSSLLKNRLSSRILKRWTDDICLVDPYATAPAGVDWKHCIGVCEDVSAQELMKTAVVTGLQHIVQASTPDLVEEVELAAKMISQPHLFSKDTTEEIFKAVTLNSSPGGEGAAAEAVAVAPEDLSTFRFSFAALQQKESLGSELVEFLSGVPRIDTVKDSVLTIASELFSNALDAKKRIAPGVACSDVPAEMMILRDYSKLVIGVEDPYGLIDPQKVLLRILETYERGLSKTINLNEDKGGAGIGCRMMFEMALSFCICVTPGKKTTVACVMPLGQSQKSQLLNGKNIHLSTLGGS